MLLYFLYIWTINNLLSMYCKLLLTWPLPRCKVQLHGISSNTWRPFVSREVSPERDSYGNHIQPPPTGDGMGGFVHIHHHQHHHQHHHYNPHHSTSLKPSTSPSPVSLSLSSTTSPLLIAWAALLALGFKSIVDVCKRLRHDWHCRFIHLPIICNNSFMIKFRKSEII